MNLGTIHYSQALNRQLGEIESLRLNRQEQRILFVESHPIVTLGLRSNREKDLQGLAEIEVLKVDRGGEATYHGPGQLMVFPIVHLPTLNLSVREWVALLLNTTQEFLKSYGIPSEWSESKPGIFTRQGKIASIGLKIQNGWSRHGLAINVKGNFEPFTKIRSCGVQCAQVDQMANWNEREWDWQELGERWEQIFREQLPLR